MDPLFAIIIKEKEVYYVIENHGTTAHHYHVFSSIFPFSGYAGLSTSADTFSFVGLQLVGCHEMGRRESIRGRMGNFNINRLCEKMHSIPLFSIAIKEKGSV